MIFAIELTLESIRRPGHQVFDDSNKIEADSLAKALEQASTMTELEHDLKIVAIKLTEER